MEAKEKAEELAGKFFSINNEKESKLGTNPFISRSYAKECAKIAAIELIEAFKQLSIEESGRVYIDFGHGYWESVLKEIDNI